ncbi:hypothetical protein NSPZN2_10812 [Nitrospira defluvii]|uniref:Uncharacterized protein n=1 Tax=Nitrospira defluvii TaxID=330214 RepID=A0ABN7KNG5_9BACT|nr:hypothetical protein NSPZN2_10812 [Nitrospira defluvii]
MPARSPWRRNQRRGVGRTSVCRVRPGRKPVAHAEGDSGQTPREDIADTQDVTKEWYEPVIV